jgi:hypothetical protein
MHPSDWAPSYYCRDGFQRGIEFDPLDDEADITPVEIMRNVRHLDDYEFLFEFP